MVIWPVSERPFDTAVALREAKALKQPWDVLPTDGIRIAHLVSRMYIKVREFVEVGAPQPPLLLSTYTPNPRPMSYFDDNNFGYETSERYLGGSDYQPLSQGSYFKPSPSPEWNASQLGYEGSTLLDGVGCQFIDPHALQRDCTYNYNHGNSWYMSRPLEPILTAAPGVNADGSYRHTHSYPSSSGSESWPTSEYGQPMAGPSSVEGDGEWTVNIPG